MAGITLAFRLRDQDRVGLVFSGEDETSTSAWHEGINFAAAQRCPLIVVVQAGTEASIGAHTRARDFGQKAAGYGVASASVDGGDVLAVHGAVLAAAERARSGKGTTLVEARGCPASRRVHRAARTGEGTSLRTKTHPIPVARFRARLVGGAHRPRLRPRRSGASARGPKSGLRANRCWASRLPLKNARSGASTAATRALLRGIASSPRRAGSRRRPQRDRKPGNDQQLEAGASRQDPARESR